MRWLHYIFTIRGGIILRSLVESSSNIYIDGRELFTDLVILEMQDYDVILSMDWLAKCNATIDCKKKRVVFQLSEKDQFMFVGTLSKARMPIISIMKVEKLLKKGCMGYLMSL